MAQPPRARKTEARSRAAADRAKKAAPWRSHQSQNHLPVAGADAAPGLAVRRIAADIIDGVLRRNRSLDEQLDGGKSNAALAALPDRDRALARALVAMVLRRLGTLRHLIGLFLERGLPKEAPRVETALLIGAAQILFLDVPDHAAVDLAVRLVQADRHAARYAGLVNAVLRRIAREGAAHLAALDTIALDTPQWLMARWIKTYGEATARAIAAANGREPALDLTVKSEPEFWAAQLGGQVLSTGSVRVDRAWRRHGAAGFRRRRLVGSGRCRRVAGASARRRCRTSRRRSVRRAGRQGGAARRRRRPRHRGRSLAGAARAAARISNRLSLKAELVCADVTEWQAEPFDAVLLDAPCSSTGTIRRHPDVPWLKQPADIDKLARCSAG